MAVEKLKFITASGSEEAYDRALSVCLSESSFRFETAENFVSRGGGHSLTAPNPYAAPLAQLGTLLTEIGVSLTEPPIPSPLPGTMPAEELASLTADLSAIEEEYRDLSREMDEIRSALKDRQMLAEQLRHLEDSDISLGELLSLRFVSMRFGWMPEKVYDSMEEYLSELTDASVLLTHRANGAVYLLYLVPQQKSARIDALFQSLQFTRIQLPKNLSGTPKDAIAPLLSEAERLSERLSVLRAKQNGFADTYRSRLCRYGESLLLQNRLFEIRKKVYFRKGDFCMAGWCAERKAKAFAKAMEQIPTVVVAVEEPAPGVDPPTVLHNWGVFRPFEDFVRMYGLPSYGEMDPTPFVAITYFLFFGMMFGDAGQGIVLSLVGCLLGFVFHVTLGKIIAICGVSSCLFGLVYGSFFGIEGLMPAVFSPADNSNMNTILMVAVSIGIVCILITMVLNIRNGIRERNLKKALLSPNGVAGFLFYLSAVILIVTMMDVKIGDLSLKTALSSVLPLPLCVTIAVLTLLLLFFADPLYRLISHRKKTEKTGVLDFVLESFFELFEVVLSYLTNTISFIRIGAFALSHVGMMTVIYLLSGAAGSHVADLAGANPVVLVIGNLFVIGFEGLIVGIQVLRLEFYELFGRFYSGGGHDIVRPEPVIIGAALPEK